MPNTIRTILLRDKGKYILEKLLLQSTIEIRTYHRAKNLLFKAIGMSNEDIAVKLDIGHWHS